MRGQRRKRLFLLATALVAVGVGVLGYATGLLRRSELQSIDARFSIRGGHRTPRNILLVLIDSKSINTVPHLGEKFVYPFPRRLDADVIDRLRHAGARTISMDMEFAHETDVADDNALIEAVGRAHGKIVLATTEVGPGGQTQVLGGGMLLHELGARPAEALLPLDPEGVARRFAYSYNGLHSFAVVSAETATGRPIARSRFERGMLPIDFDGPPETMRSLSYVDVLNGHFSPAAVAGKIVIVGASAPILHDYKSTATSGSTVMPGPEILANEIDTLLRGIPLRDAPGWLNVVLIGLLGCAVPLGGLRMQRWRSLLDALALAALFAVAVQLAFNGGLILNFVYPLLALAVATLGTIATLYITETIERERVRDVFSRFVPGGVVDEVLAITGGNPRLAGVERDCTVLFSDLRGFTSFSETQPAARVIEVVNFYLNEMTEAILDAGGTLISYMGDGIMAIFGAPLTQDDHADRAVAAAREMVGPRLARFNAWLAEQGFERGFAMGVGLNSGPVMAGSVGSAQRMEYTAIGDTTNTASRLEGLTKGSGFMIFISETTRERMRSPENLVRVGEFEIRGRASKMAVWSPEPIGEVEASAPATTYASVSRGEGDDEARGGSPDGPAESEPSAARAD
jgi:adenylate cyclase